MFFWRGMTEKALNALPWRKRGCEGVIEDEVKQNRRKRLPCGRTEDGTQGVNGVLIMRQNIKKAKFRSSSFADIRELHFTLDFTFNHEAERSRNGESRGCSDVGTGTGTGTEQEQEQRRDTGRNNKADPKSLRLYVDFRNLRIQESKDSEIERFRNQRIPESETY